MPPLPAVSASLACAPWVSASQPVAPVTAPLCPPVTAPLCPPVTAPLCPPVTAPLCIPVHPCACLCMRACQLPHLSPGLAHPLKSRIPLNMSVQCHHGLKFRPAYCTQLSARPARKASPLTTTCSQPAGRCVRPFPAVGPTEVKVSDNVLHWAPIQVQWSTQRHSSPFAQ